MVNASFTKTQTGTWDWASLPLKLWIWVEELFHVDLEASQLYPTPCQLLSFRFRHYQESWRILRRMMKSTYTQKIKN